MPFRLLLPLLPFACAAIAHSQESATPSSDDGRPNIVFIFSDDHAPHAIGAYARDEAMPFGKWLASVDATPRIDQLAESGMRFRNSFCTNSICGPSRAVVLTGKHSHVNGFMNNGNRFDGDQVTFPKLLQTAGYRTAMIGKWHLGSDPQGLRPLGGAARSGPLLQPGPRFGPRPASGRGALHRHRHGSFDRVAARTEGTRWAVPLDGPAQGATPHLDAGRSPPRAVADEALPEPPTLFDDYADNAPGAARQEMTIRDHMTMLYDLFVIPREDDVAGGPGAWTSMDCATSSA